MTKEEKDLLLKDLCARLPYGVKCLVNFDDGTKDIMTLKTGLPNSFGKWDFYNENCSGCSNIFKPYLRPISSMTEEEREEFRKTGGVMSYSPQHDTWAISAFAPEAYDWLNKNKFDYRGLIEKGLALEATEGMYKH